MTNDELQRTFLALREECIWLVCCHNTYAGLYESGPETRAILATSARIFFGDLSRILAEYYILQVCKITDPPKTGDKTNLTTAHMDALLCDASLMTTEIKHCSDAILCYRALLATARNRLISHLDRDAVFKGKPTGAHTKEEMDAFLENLQLYCDAVGRAVGIGPLDFRINPGSGDAMDLIGILKAYVDARAVPTAGRLSRLL